LLKIVLSTENITFLFWIAIKVKRKKMIFDVPILDLDQSFVKLVAKLMAHTVYKNLFHVRRDILAHNIAIKR